METNMDMDMDMDTDTEWDMDTDTEKQQQNPVLNPLQSPQLNHQLNQQQNQQQNRQLNQQLNQWLNLNQLLIQTCSLISNTYMAATRILIGFLESSIAFNKVNPNGDVALQTRLYYQA